MDDPRFSAAISRHIWDTKYRYRENGVPCESSIEQSWDRIARALAAPEREAEREAWRRRFRGALEGFRFLPGGRIQAGAGTPHRVTLFNCFVMGIVEDSMDGIFDALKEGAMTLQQGGGVGYDFSTLRPRGSAARSSGTIASGPVSFMTIWDSMCATLLSTGARRGAMMATLRCDHPDIESFITAKRDPRLLRHFNLSVLVSDDFMRAIRDDADWALVFPDEGLEGAPGETVMRAWTGTEDPVPCRVMKTVRARALWDTIMRSTYEYAEPGVLFIDRINRLNNLAYRERISATNPCGEIPLPPYGACDLGSLNLVAFVQDPFADDARLDFDGLSDAAAVAVRMLDNVIDVSRFPLDRQAEQARGTRRVGLGITGLADALIMLGLVYGSPESVALVERVMRLVCHTAYRTSIDLAREKGPFPFFERDAYLRSEFVATLPADIRDGIARHGIRNSHLLAIAPTGTVSLLANNVSSSLEPVFDFAYHRRVLELDGSYTEYPLKDHALVAWEALHPGEPRPASFIDAQRLAPGAHIDIQAAVQPYVDNAVSKTINVPAGYPFEDFEEIYVRAWERGLKGCTTFRPNPVTGSVLRAGGGGFEHARQCCDIEREEA